MAEGKSLFFDFSAWTDLKKYLDSHPDIVTKYTSVAMKKAALLAEGDMKKEAPVDKGQLRKTIVSSITPMMSVVQPTVSYALAVHEGTSANTLITPVNKKSLHFTGKLGDTFLKKVMQRARKGNPFVQRAKDNIQSRVEGFFLEALQGIINEIKNV